MKRITCLMVLIAIFFCGCSSNNNNASSSVESSTTTAEEQEEEREELISEDEPDDEVEYTADFNVDTNNVFTIQEMTYQIPNNWVDNGDNGENTRYYYPDSGMIMIMFDETLKNQSFHIATLQDEYIGGVLDSFDRAELIHKENTYVAGEKAVLFDFYMDLDSFKNTYNIATVFSTQNGCYAIMMVDFSGEGIYRHDFDDIVNNIALDESAEIKTSADNGTGDTSNGSADDTNEKNATMGERNALAKAKDYLRIMAFSKNGLIDQLKYEGYSQEEALYAVEQCGADWNKQASLKATEYLDVMSFSESGLIEQLQYDGFTKEEASYGVASCGADWYTQAVNKANEYISILSFSRSGLIDQLVFDGFTREQAEKAADALGY